MKVREYKQVTITNKGEKSILNNHPWVYAGEVVSAPIINNGEIVDVINLKGKYLGSGYYNANSKIIIRLISRNANDKFDYDFYKRRVRYAWDYRKNVMPNDLNCVRIIFGEADFFPGLTIDKFNDVLVAQILSLGIDVNKDYIFKALLEVMEEDNIDIRGIYLRNDSNIRKLEGLEEGKSWYYLKDGASSETNTIIVENELKYYVDFENGQKTGFFLDQKYNRVLIRNMSKGKSLLDCCTHTGSFSMNAYLGGAKQVTALDISLKALEDARHNFELNGIKDIETVESDAFDYLEKLQSGEKKFDFIILDPPAFTKSRSTIQNALKGYEELNYLGMKALPRGGFLATASCSHFAYEDLFLEAITKASKRANVTLRLISVTHASYDHPEVVGIPETKYLKFFIFQIV